MITLVKSGVSSYLSERYQVTSSRRKHTINTFSELPVVRNNGEEKSHKVSMTIEALDNLKFEDYCSFFK